MNLPAVPVAGRATAESRFRVSFFIRIGRRNLGKNLDAGISRCNARNEVLVNTCLRHFVILNDVRRVRRRGFRDKFSPVVLICQRISRRARTGRAGGGEKKKKRVKIGGRVKVRAKRERWNADVLKRPGIDPVNYIFLARVAPFKKGRGERKFRMVMYSHLRLLFFPSRSSADRNTGVVRFPTWKTSL